MWHRYFVFAYEQTLRNECGYNGPLPYWNWFANGGDIKQNSVFDGSATSMGGDGAYVEHNGTTPVTGLYIPSGDGGGCISSGPFAKYITPRGCFRGELALTACSMTANLGPVAPAMDGLVAVSTPLEYNPRCVRRDLSTLASTTWFTYENLLNATLGAASVSIEALQNEVQGRFGDLFLGLHATGHVGPGAGEFARLNAVFLTLVFANFNHRCLRCVFLSCGPQFLSSPCQ